MDFYIDIGVAALLRLLKDRRSWRKYRAAIVKVAAAIMVATESDPTFADEVKAKVEASK